MNSLIDKLDFGKESAESEQSFLEKVFLPTAIFQRLSKGERDLVLGRKGSGKTAVCLRLHRELEEKQARVSLITPRDLSRFRMTLIDKGSLNSAEASLLSWKFVFLVELANYVLDEASTKLGGNYLIWPEPYKKVRGFIVENTAQHINWIDKTFKIIRAIKKVGVATVETEIDTSTLAQNVADFADKLDEITNTVYTATASLDIGPVHILVDKVDELWDPGPESRLLVIGLLRASKEINDQCPIAKIVVFLRSDIYDSLQFHDSDKYHSSEDRISWSESDLKSLITLRARASTGVSVRRDSSDKIWSMFFCNEVAGEDSFKHLLKHTLMRPRDLIQLCKLCRDKAQDRHHASIAVDDIREALPQYSRWKLGDIRDEYIVQYPFLERVLLGVFQHARSRLSLDDIAKRLDIVKPHLVKEYESFYFEPISNLLQILYNIGFLGVVREGKTLHSSRGDNVVMSYAQEFEIHPAFRHALDIVDGRTPEAFIGEVTVGPVSSSNVVIGGSAVSVGGDVNISNIYYRMEQDVLSLVTKFNGQIVPGNFLNTSGAITLPSFSRILRDYSLAKAGVRVDIFATGPDNTWIIETKGRELRVSDLHQIASYCALADAQGWVVSFVSLKPEIKEVARNLGLFVSGSEEWEALRRLLRG